MKEEEFNFSQHVIAESKLAEQRCDECLLKDRLIETLLDEIRKGTKTRRNLSATIRLLQGALIRDMEREFEQDNSSVSQADGYAS